MKREILFRGKTQYGEWVYGSYLQTDDNTNNPMSHRPLNLRHQIWSYWSGDWNMGGWSPMDVIPETIGQFTGITDKNGVKIFEGDILEDRYYPLGANPKAIKYYKIGVMVYRANYFGLQLKIEGSTILDTELANFYHKNKREIYKHPNIGENWVDKLFCDSRDLEIIGNIHDNPELLK